MFYCIDYDDSGIICNTLEYYCRSDVPKEMSAPPRPPKYSAKINDNHQL